MGKDSRHQHILWGLVAWISTCGVGHPFSATHPSPIAGPPEAVAPIAVRQSGKAWLARRRRRRPSPRSPGTCVGPVHVHGTFARTPARV